MPDKSGVTLREEYWEKMNAEQRGLLLHDTFPKMEEEEVERLSGLSNYWGLRDGKTSVHLHLRKRWNGEKFILQEPVREFWASGKLLAEDQERLLKIIDPMLPTKALDFIAGLSWDDLGFPIQEGLLVRWTGEGFKDDPPEP